MKLDKTMVVAFDIDGTLITLDDKPRQEVINLYLAFQALGPTMVIWSGGGKEYAERWAERLGLTAYYISSKFGSKPFRRPDITFDDLNVNLGMWNIQVPS